MRSFALVLFTVLLLGTALLVVTGPRAKAEVPTPVPTRAELVPTEVVEVPAVEPPAVEGPAAEAPAAEPAPSAAAPPAGPAPDVTTLPLDKGLPVVVRVAVYFATVDGIDENEGTFDATIDVRLRWEDPRQRFPYGDVPGGMLELRGPAADARLATMWAPQIAITNLIGEPSRQLRGMRMWSSGEVELMTRTIAKFATPIDLTEFPFDEQQLRVELLSLGEDVDRLFLDFRQRDLDFSRVAKGVELEEWDPGLVELLLDPVPGWHGEAQARVYASLEVARRPGRTVAAVFIPLLASLLIPMLAMWLNTVEDGEFKVEAFELANIVIGGLFAVVALNFTISSEYPSLAASDNTVTRLLTLNYATLALAVVMNLVLFRFDVVRQRYGRHAQEATFRYLMWALPLMVFGTAVAMVLASMA